MLMKERKRLHQQYLVDLIRNLITTDINKLRQAHDINCYAFSRGLTYPDTNWSIYASGMLYRLQSGYGDFFKTSTNPELIDNFIKLDSIALGQTCTRVNFNDIEENDGRRYFGIIQYRICTSKSIFANILTENQMSWKWHFICRTDTNLWLHKLNFM